MRHFTALGILLLAPSMAFAHVSVRPRESQAGAEERYTVRVPTEGAIATTHVQLEIPPGLMVLEILPHDGATFETAKQGDRITAITWEKEIPPKSAAEFVFRARNPESGDVIWKAHQHFKDGTTADWVGPAGDRRPASVTKLGGIRVVHTPHQAPNANAYAELFVRSNKEECLNRLIPLCERHFRRASPGWSLTIIAAESSGPE